MLGAFLVAPDVYAQQREPDGCYYAPRYRSKELVLAVTAGLHTDAPNVGAVLQELAVAPGSKLTLVTERKIRKMFEAEDAKKKTAALLDGMRLLATQAERQRETKYRRLCSTVGEFMLSLGKAAWLRDVPYPRRP